MKCYSRFIFALLAMLSVASWSSAAVIVQDRFGDNDRTDPAPPTYSEVGVDSDADNDIESSWFGTSGTLATSPGNLILGTSGGTTGSQSWATYFTPDASPITLSNDGDTLKVTWAFNLSGTAATLNSSQNMRMALVDTSAAARLATDTNPGNDSYTGYAVFLNMGPTLGRSNPMELKPRNTGVNPNNLLSSGGNWLDVNADGGTNGATGYATGVDYVFDMTVTRTGGGLQVDTSMSGGTLNDTGSMSASYFDAAPASFTFDTFTLRPSNTGTTAEFFNTSLFQVDVTAIPEPTSLALLGISVAACVLRRQR
jgi:hypothetical protein